MARTQHLFLVVVCLVAVVAIFGMVGITSIFQFPASQEPVIGRAFQSPVIFTDNFNRADSTTLGNGWVEQGDLLIKNNTLTAGAIKGYDIATEPSVRGTDQDVSASFASADNNFGPRFGIILRFQDISNYYLAYRQTGGTSQLRISRIVGGVERILGTASLANPQKNQYFQLHATAIGQTLTLAIDGVTKVTLNDPTFSTGSVGLLMGSPSIANPHRADNFAATVEAGGTPTAPAAPTNLAASASTGQITLTWTDNSNNEQGFKIERSNDGTTWTQIATTGTNIATYTNTGLTAGTTYYYRVRAYNSAGDSSYTNTASATTPSTPTVPTAPTNLAASASTGQITVTWNDNSNNEQGFKIERASTTTGPWTQIATTGTNIATYTNTGLTAGTTYYYRVRAYNSAGDSSYTNTASATTPSVPTAPVAPSNLAAIGWAPIYINLSWNDNSANEQGFKIWRGLIPTGPYAQVGTTAANTVSYQDGILQSNTTYYYKITAYNAVGDSTFSNIANGTTLPTGQQGNATLSPNPPSNLAASAASSSQINLGWVDNSANEQGFIIERALASTGPWVRASTVAANIISYQDTGLPSDTTEYYRVRAYNSGGNSSFTNVASATTTPFVGTPCWMYNGSCDASCTYQRSDFLLAYSTACVKSCDPQSYYYRLSGTCAADGSGTCFKSSGTLVSQNICTNATFHAFGDATCRNGASWCVPGADYEVGTNCHIESNLLTSAPNRCVWGMDDPRNAPVTQKVFVVNFNPLISGGRRLQQVIGGHDAHVMTPQILDAISASTGRYVNYQITQFVDQDLFPKFYGDGYRYNESTYFACTVNGTCHPQTGTSYAQIWQDYDLCNKFAAHQIDELVLWGLPGGPGLDEFGYKIPHDAVPYNMPTNAWLYQLRSYLWMSGPGNGIPDCNNRTIFIMGWSSMVGIDNAVHSYGHSMESVLAVTLGRGYWNPCSGTSPFDKFSCYNNSPGRTNITQLAACGDVHQPPNAGMNDSRSVIGYDYGNRTNFVPYTCNSWPDYPNIGAPVTTNCAPWGCDQLSYMQWWLGHMPRKPGTYNSDLLNWLRYRVDFDNAVRQAKGQ